MINYSSHIRSFGIKWNIKIEPVYRLLDNIDYINNFFEKGEIMLSCFNNFKKNPDEMQGDKEEGQAIVGEFGNGPRNSHVIYESGLNAFVMSTTSKINDTIIKDFNAIGALKIKDPSMFAFEIAKKLPFVESGIEGFCNYKSSRVEFLQGEEGKILNSLDFNIPSSHLIFEEITKGMELFLKLDKYEYQNEYRLAWFSNEEVKNSIIVKCPEARRFCDKIIF
jgi:hypothetical protein